ncbi:hypothetical protein RAA17_23955 [Komagataeibacter rhaeticus]|nr:hypothetical protein [Komagataeibacter rhaeticus]
MPPSAPCWPGWVWPCSRPPASRPAPTISMCPSTAPMPIHPTGMSATTRPRWTNTTPATWQPSRNARQRRHGRDHQRQWGSAQISAGGSHVQFFSQCMVELGAWQTRYSSTVGGSLNQ